MKAAELLDRSFGEAAVFADVELVIYGLHSGSSIWVGQLLS